MSEEIVLVVNGKRHTVQAAEDTPLLATLATILTVRIATKGTSASALRYE